VYLTVRRGAGPSATQKTCTDPPQRQKAGEKCGLEVQNNAESLLDFFHEPWRQGADFPVE
jgi:hypothetical protein